MKKKTRILVVDDDHEVLQVYALLLRRANYEVWEASTGQQALKLATEKRPDLVLLDVMLPDLSGFEVCGKIKADKTLQDVFVVMISGGATSSANMVDGLDTGADEYLVKPIEGNEFLARIRTIVRLQETAAALRASEHHYRQLVDILPDAVCLIELPDRLAAVNSQAATMLEYSCPAEVLEKSLYDLVHPADQPRLRADLAAMAQTGLIRNAEYRMLRKSGAAFPVEVRATLLRNSLANPAQLVALVRDITIRKRIEEELRNLSRRISEAQELERQRVARELHDGVNQIIASAKMRLRKVADLSGTLNPAAAEMLSRCEKQLVLALEENRRIAHNLRPSDLDELGLAEACRNYCREFQSRANLTVECHVPQLEQRLPPEVELNLFRIIQEAINNAEKHARATTVRLRIAFQSETLTVTIQDDGCGFSPGTLTIDKRSGHGIGLTNIRERATSLGGACEIDSTPNQGTTITVRVPLAENDDAAG